MPLRLFELSDVVLVDPSSSTATRNCRRLAAVLVAREGGFEVIHGLLNRLMEKLGIEVGGEPRFLSPAELQFNTHNQH